jgi:hypothetical protein
VCSTGALRRLGRRAAVPGAGVAAVSQQAV